MHPLYLRGRQVEPLGYRSSREVHRLKVAGSDKLYEVPQDFAWLVINFHELKPTDGVCA